VGEFIWVAVVGWVAVVEPGGAANAPMLAQNARTDDQFGRAGADAAIVQASPVQAWLMAPVSMLVTSAFGRSRNSDWPFTM
jgi:hypothetical protein